METRSWSLKMVLIGDPGVGKTTIRRTYLGENFRRNYIATIGADFSFKQLEFDSDFINVSIWDLAGQREVFKNVHPIYYRGSAGALVVYDVTDRSTMDNVSEWVDKYQSLTGDLKCPILIVGNKIDLLDETEGISEKEQLELIEDLKEKYEDEFPIISARTSAKTGEAINASFDRLVKTILEWEKKQPKDKSKSESEIGKFIKVSYLIAFHDTLGPQILTKVPKEKDKDDQEFASAIKISAILDFEDVIENSNITGTAPWRSPKGTLYYIAFTVENENARGNQSLFIIGLVVDRELREIMSQYQSITDGYLHSTMNEFVRRTTINNEDFTSQDSKIDPDNEVIKGFEEELEKLRRNVFKTVKSEL